jgi:RNA polymerase sigma-70 factor (ECF subfamily)
MTEASDLRIAELVRQARDANASIREQHAAFATLVARFEDLAFATALAACEDAESARDACQEAFLLAWRKLPALREPAAFGGWLERLVRTQCARVRRRRAAEASRAATFHDGAEPASDVAELVGRREVDALVRDFVARLPRAEREAVLLFYFLGESLRAVARALDVTESRAGRLVYEARLRLRRGLPRGVTRAFWGRTPTPSFATRVLAGMLDDLTGEYRFDARPDHRVIVRREGDVLVSEAGGQRHVLTSNDSDTLVSTAFDGEARFRRDRRGRISHFVYYEFGRRLGVARKVATGRGGPRSLSPSRDRSARETPAIARRRATNAAAGRS